MKLVIIIFFTVVFSLAALAVQTAVSCSSRHLSLKQQYLLTHTDSTFILKLFISDYIRLLEAINGKRISAESELVRMRETFGCGS